MDIFLIAFIILLPIITAIVALIFIFATHWAVILVIVAILSGVLALGGVER